MKATLFFCIISILLLSALISSSTLESANIEGFNFLTSVTVPGNPVKIQNMLLGRHDAYWEMKTDVPIPALRVGIIYKASRGFVGIYMKNDADSMVFQSPVQLILPGKSHQFVGSISSDDERAVLVFFCKFSAATNDSTNITLSCKSKQPLSKDLAQHLVRAWEYVLNDQFAEYAEIMHRRKKMYEYLKNND